MRGVIFVRYKIWKTHLAQEWNARRSCLNVRARRCVLIKHVRSTRCGKTAHPPSGSGRVSSDEWTGKKCQWA